MNAIVATAADLGIGNDGRLLFSLKEDMRYFRRMTLGKTVVMGRKTLDSFPGGKPLPGRRNIVLTRDPSISREGAESAVNLPELFDKLRDVPPDDVFVIGGGEIYRLLLPFCRRVFMTRVEASSDASVFFPDVPNDPAFRLVSRSAPLTENGLRYCFYVYERRAGY